MVYSVSQHPQVEAKMVEELRSLNLLATPEQPTPRPIQWDDIPKLTYINVVIKVAFAPLQDLKPSQHDILFQCGV